MALRPPVGPKPGATGRPQRPRRRSGTTRRPGKRGHRHGRQEARATPACQSTIGHHSPTARVASPKGHRPVDSWRGNPITIRLFPCTDPISPGTTLLAMSAPARIAAALGLLGDAVAVRLVGAVGSAMNAALLLTDLTVSYDRHPAVHHVSAEIPAGEITAIVGPNGAGKSTLPKALLGLAPRRRRPHRVHGHAHRLSRRSRPRSIVSFLDLGARHRPARPLVALRRLRRRQAGRPARRPARHRGGRAAGFERRSIDTLSVGQFQRVLFARLLPQDADLVLLDEPFAAIDSKTVADLMVVIRRWREEKRTVVAVLHDFDQVRRDFSARAAAGARAGRCRPDRARCRPRTCWGPARWPRPGTSMPAPATCRMRLSA